MTEKPLIAFIATYDDVADARQDYQEVKQAHSQGFIGEYDAAIVWKNDKGKIEIDSVSDEASRKWLWAGLGVGALIGLIFPPSILATSAIGALTGAVIGKFRDGIAQDDLEQIGEALTGDNAALVVVARGSGGRGAGEDRRQTRRIEQADRGDLERRHGGRCSAAPGSDRRGVRAVAATHQA